VTPGSCNRTREGRRMAQENQERPFPAYPEPARFQSVSSREKESPIEHAQHHAGQERIHSRKRPTFASLWRSASLDSAC